MTELWMGSALFAAIVLVLSLMVVGMRRVLLAQRPCVVTVNSNRELLATTFRKLLPVLLDAGVSIPSTCGGKGTCGLCRVTVTSGRDDPSAAELGRISTVDARAGVRLACQVVVRGDMAIDVPEEAFGIETFSCTVRSNRVLAPFIAELVLDLPEGAKLQRRAGCFVQVTAPPYTLRFGELRVPPPHQAIWQRYGLRELSVQNEAPVTRAYSLANTPGESGLVLNVRLALPPPGKDVPPGVVSSYLFSVEPGTVIPVSGPYGSFGAKDSDREMVFIGGGAGMAPLRCIIHDQLERKQTKRRISFWYGARSRADVFYSDEFDRLQEEYDNFSWTVALSEPTPEDDWGGATGFIHEVVYRRYLERHPTPENCEYYLCGPPLMTHAVFALLDELGVDRGNVFSDDFGV